MQFLSLQHEPHINTLSSDGYVVMWCNQIVITWVAQPGAVLNPEKLVHATVDTHIYFYSRLVHSLSLIV